ncbi:MAG: nicotinate-nucleotide adenylyltransferase [Burkholderiales bacterium]
MSAPAERRAAPKPAGVPSGDRPTYPSGEGRRIGIFGGSFDPVHNAHVALARLALSELRLDEVLWVPVGQPWQKLRHITSATDREAMVKLAIADEPRFTLSRIELERSGPSFTIDTVRELRAGRPGAQWFLVIGQDQYAGFHTWNGWQELLGLVTLAIADRPDAVHSVDPQVLAVPHATVALPMMDVSSTDIRTRVEHGQGITDLVPEPVARYIARHRLYRD